MNGRSPNGVIEQASIGSRVHEHLVEQGPLDLMHVQADEIRVKGRQMTKCQGLAVMISTRLWLAGVVQHLRDSRRYWLCPTRPR